MDRKLRVGDSLGEVFSIYGAKAGVLMPVAFWLFLAVAIVNGIAGEDVSLFALVFVVSTVAGTLYQGMVVGLVRDVQDGRPESSMGGMVRSAMPFLLPLTAAGLLSGLGMFLGFLLLVVPGFILLTIWAVIAPAIVIEGCGAIGAFWRSRELVRGNGWPVFGVMIVTGVIATAGYLAITVIAEGIAEGPLVRIVLSAIASTLTAPIGALVAPVLYYRLVATEKTAPPPRHLRTV